MVDKGTCLRFYKRKDVQEAMHRLLKIRPAITWLKPNTLERAVKKTQLLEKLYEK